MRVLSRVSPPGPALDAERLGRITARAPAADRSEADLAADLADIADAGLLRAPLPAPSGGAGWGTEPAGALPLCSALRSLGRANLSVARLYEGHVNAAKLVLLYGSGQQRRTLADDLQAGRLLGVWGADGARPLGLDGVRLRGGKAYASGLGLVSRVVASLDTESGPQLLLLPTGESAREDPSVWRMAGMRATASGHYDFTGAEIGPETRLGQPGDYHREPHFEGGVWRYCAAHLGGAEALYLILLEMLSRSGRDGDPHQERRVAEAGRACETARLWIEAAACRVEAAEAHERAAAYALLAREATEEACLFVIATVDRALGAASFAEAHPAERIRRDLSLFLRQAGPDGKRAAAARALIAMRALPEAL